MLRRFRPLSTCALLASAMMAANGLAMPIAQFEYSATVTEVRDPNGLLGGSVGVGQVLTGVLTYDLGNPGVALNNTLTATNGVFSYSVDDAFIGLFLNPPGSADQFIFESGPGTTVPSVPELEALVILTDDQGTAFPADEVPQPFPDISEFEEAILNLSDQDFFQSNGITINANVTRVVLIPEPSLAASALAMALCVLSVPRRLSRS